MVRIGWLALAATLTPAPARAARAGALEAQVLAALNLARTDPAGFARSLRTLRSWFQEADWYLPPGRDEANVTVEGVAAVDEAIRFLERQRPVPPVAPGALLAAAAADHGAEQAATGDTGHEDEDGADPGERMRRRGGDAYVAELIEYGAVDAVDAVRQLVVDDGVADRGHRAVLFDPRFRFAGIACNPHPTFRRMCVIELGLTGGGGPPARLQLARADPTRRRPTGR